MSNLILAIIFFASAAMIYKAATQAECRQVGIILAERAAVIIFMGSLLLITGGFFISARLAGIAAAGGAAIFFSRWALLLALTMGKISASWTAVNLSVAIPTAASIFIWNEIPDAKTIIGLLLVPAAIILLREEKDVD